MAQTWCFHRFVTSTNRHKPAATKCEPAKWESGNKHELAAEEDKERNSSPLSVLAHAAAPQLMLSKIRSLRSFPIIAAARPALKNKKWYA
ncbi:hypothetical protein D8674_028559 [Pyrus ussuriensis x Pyrus communis]|uniref:Uncharacterized protein n=1 Tax=Pyrus ussuriensis x Pyrus communis TaxID=2448454 RepID=A0A5N5I1N1_9ROSA|nr:hypothetical protein D8674_028559 [Pyrus ussuriensis x Pyrus communis]